ncbi:hypothetical protein L207DRAFT_571557 [Hyaloscypha variabilis F]|uniref:J domain-containing protein n=1 Tax=Hyaloscypha variabilis (strain UAMH 11265 / GT02V1 / F) TaxID=1149755 RepID=A0A2J6R4G1_HYAVF|nr:hypothetical protein L207DRAFT_571557 [Hyaloscypha variabilis F]
MKFNFFSSGSKPSPKPKPRAKPTQRGKSKQQAKPKKQPRPKLPNCPPNAYIPHYRNLGLPPGALAEEIKSAWRALGLRLHPDKIRNPAMKSNASAAMILVNEAHEQLFKESGDFISRLGRSTKDIMKMDASEQARKLLDRHVCEKVVRRKPWFWAYRARTEAFTNGSLLCGEQWATMGHNVVDSILPLKASDAIWEVVDGEWRYPASGASLGFEKLTFYGPCEQTYTVTLPVKRAERGPPRWSTFKNTACNTSLDVWSFDVLCANVMLGIFLFVFRRQAKILISYVWDFVMFAILSSLWCVLWTSKKIFMLCTWPTRKMLSVIRHVFHLVLWKLDEILDETKRYLYGTRVLRSVFFLLELVEAWQRKGFSVREIWREKGFGVTVRTRGRRHRN